MSAQLKRYRVHVYAIVRVPMEVEAESPQGAVDKADEIFCSGPEYLLTQGGEYAEDVEGFLVDELNASGEWDEHCKSIAFDKERRPQWKRLTTTPAEGRDEEVSL